MATAALVADGTTHSKLEDVGPLSDTVIESFDAQQPNHGFHRASVVCA